MSLGTFKGQVAGPGFGHFSKCRPKFYQNELDLTGVALYRGTINIRIYAEMPHFPMPNTRRIRPQSRHPNHALCNGGIGPAFGVIFRKTLLKFRWWRNFPNVAPGLTAVAATFRGPTLSCHRPPIIVPTPRKKIASAKFNCTEVSDQCSAPIRGFLKTLQLLTLRQRA
jgi:hypothetical protein